MRPVMITKPLYEGRTRKGTEDVAQGVFLAWGNEYVEFESGPGNYTVALVEMPDGTVQTPVPTSIRFLDSEIAKQEQLNEFAKNPIIVG